MARIAIAGWQHETNTFALKKADWAAFADADEWPGMSAGSELIENVENVHLPIAGAIKSLKEQQHEIVPILWCSATPCSYVTEDAYEKICADILSRLRDVLPLDAIYLDLHGAMVCEHLQDGEGVLLSRIREVVGNDLPIFASLDLHANVTPLMVEKASVIDIYRTYPHVDMAETGYRLTNMLCHYLRQPTRLYKSFRQIPFLVPLNTGCTLISPCKEIYAALPEMINEGVRSLSFACGFHLSDIYDAGPSVVGYGDSRSAADDAVNGLADLVNSRRADFYQKIWQAEKGVRLAQREFTTRGRTIVLADTQDNPGGGGAGDTTGVLRAMIGHKVENGLFGVINDAETAAAAHRAGIGKTFTAELGGRSGISGDRPLVCEARVRNLSDGRFTAAGPMYKGAHMVLGPTALLEISAILVVVCSKAVQTADQAHFKHIGVDPAEMDCVAVKSSVHFRNDFDALSSLVVIVSAPGEVYANPGTLDYKNIRPGIEITKMD